MRKLPLAFVAIAAGLLFVPAAHARGAAGGAARGLRAGLFTSRVRLPGLRPAAALGRPRSFVAQSRRATPAGFTALPGFSVPPPAPHGFGYRTSFGGDGDLRGGGQRGRFGSGFPFGFGWGELGAGWWTTGWDFPWDWQGFAGPCVQWTYPPDAPPYCASPYPAPPPP